jgi:hypothetical protein
MGTLVCRVELNKDKGLILTVENKEGKITQTAVLDGKSITITSKGEEETSTITQKPDSIAIKCKNFTLESETITCTSTKDTLHKSEQKFDVQSTKDMTLKSSAKYTADATGDLSLSGKKVAASAQDKAEISGMNVTVNGKSKTEVKGMTLTLSGTTKAEMKALSVDLSADGMMKVKGAMTTVEGQMTTVKGTLTKVG